MNDDMDSAARVLAYQHAWQVFKTAEHKAEQLIEKARTEAAKLEKWKQIPIRGAVGGMGMVSLPSGLPPGSVPAPFDATAWPTGPDLQDAMQGYHTALQDLKQKWHNLQEGEKIGFQPPGVRSVQNDKAPLG